MIMAQTHIFNFFPGSIHSSRILKTLSLFASRQKNAYIPNQQIWLNRLYFQISNLKEKKCLTVDTRAVNELGPGKFRTSADNGEEQTCYFNGGNSDTHFSLYVANRVQQSPIQFSIVKANETSFNFVNKSLAIELKSSLAFDGRAKMELQPTDRKNFNNGRSAFNKKRNTISSTYSRKLDRTVRKKPIFLSAE